MVVHLVKVHAIRKHLLDITDLNRVAGGKVLAVELDSSRVSVVEAPDKNLLDVELEVRTSLPMERLVFLDWVDWHREQVGPSHDVSLEVDAQRMLSFEVSGNRLQSHSDLFVIVSYIEGSNCMMLGSLDHVRSVPRKDKVHILELFAPFDNT